MIIGVLLRIRDSAREPVAATLHVEPLSAGARFRRGVVRLVVCWVLAVACVLVPLLHFVLVPGLIILGPVLAWLATRATVEVKSERIGCPRCEKETGVEQGSTGWPVSLRCSLCSTTFSATPDGNQGSPSPSGRRPLSS